MSGAAGDVRRVETVAAANVPHGGRCRLKGGKAYPCEELDGSGGISAGPSTVLGFTPRGRPLQVQTDGGIMTEAGYVRLRGGRLVQ